MSVGDHILPGSAAFSHECRTADETATRELGGRLADLLAGGEIILLYGDLGMGKTCLVQGLCTKLAVTEEVVSPTFTLVNTYSGRLRVHHLDFYRLDVGHSLQDIGVPEILDDIWAGEAVGLIEWPDPLIGELGPAPRLELLATPGAGSTERVWHLRGVPEIPAAWLEIFDSKGSATC